MTILIDKSFKPIAVDESSELYHLNETHVNNSALKTILKSAATFQTYWFEREREEPTPAMVFGNLAHTAILETDKFFKTYIAMPDFGDMRLKENKFAKSDWLNTIDSGKIPIKKDDYDCLIGMAESITKHKEAFNLLRNSRVEQSIYFSDPVTGIALRVRPDILSNDCSVMLDFKTTTDCTREAFAKTIDNFRYDFQMSAYSCGVESLYSVRPKYHVFLAMEKIKPFECAVYVADKEMLVRGERSFRRALNRLDESLKTNQWPRYQQTMENITLPPYAVYEEK